MRNLIEIDIFRFEALRHLGSRHWPSYFSIISRTLSRTLISSPIAWGPKENIEGSSQWLRGQGWSFQEGAILIVDDAHRSYWDRQFWNIIKSMSSAVSSCRIVTFVSYPSAYSMHGQSAVISPSFTISLRPVVDGSAALLLTKTEFDDLVPVRFSNHSFDESLLDSVFNLTNGHVGACVDLLRFIKSHESYHVLHGQADAKYTDTDFVSNIPMSHLVENVQNFTGVTWRGLPKPYHLQKKDTADIFQQVLRDGRISVPESDIPSEPLLNCIRAGWLHNRRTPDISGMSDFAFASTWHKRHVEYLLSGSEGHIDESSVIDFAVNIILKCSLLNLVQRDIGTTEQCIPEAQFRDEFYRASVVHTNGGVLSFPEFGNRRGMIDFVIPSKKWGIELLRNGDRMSKHAERFTEGEYKRWVSRGILQDYVILDFRTTIPSPHGHDVDELYYVISQDGWASQGGVTC